MATKTTPKLNITNIKSPLGGAIGPVNKKFKSQTLSSALGNQPFRKAPKIDPLDTSSQTTAQVLSQTNSILLDIQTQLTFDFASRINKENKEINKLLTNRNSATDPCIITQDHSEICHDIILNLNRWIIQIQIN